jgi:hypothetical protein
MPFDDPKAANARGRARQAELAAQMKVDVASVVAAMVSGLGRAASALEELEAAAIASLFLRAARLRDNGRDDSKIIRQAALMARNSAFRSPLDSSPRATEPKPD